MLMKLWPEDVLCRYITLWFLKPASTSALTHQKIVTTMLESASVVYLKIIIFLGLTIFTMTAALIETLFVSPQCAILSPAFKVREFSITDAVPYPISLKWHSAAEEGLR